MAKKPTTIRDYFQNLKIYLFPVFTLGVILVLFNSLVKGKTEDIFEVRKEIKDQRERLSRLIEKQAALTALDEEALKGQFLLANQALPSKREVAGFLAQVERAALESGLFIENISLEGGKIATQSGEEKEQTAAAKKKEDQFTSRIEVDGEVEKVAIFIKKLLESRRIVQVSKVELSRPFSRLAGATPSATKAILTTEVFFKTLPESMGAAEAPLPQISSQESEAYETVSLYPFLSEPLGLGGGLGLAATAGGRVSPFGP